MLLCQWLMLLALGGVSDRLGAVGAASVYRDNKVLGLRFYLWNPVTVFFVLMFTVVGVTVLSRKPRVAEDGSIKLFGRDGVIIIDQHRYLAWDRLWHSRLSRNNDHVGTYNWAKDDPIVPSG